MNAWRVILQLRDSADRLSCDRYDAAGVAAPAQITVTACDAVADSWAAATHAAIEASLRLLRATPASCSGPGGVRCMAWLEPACRHVLVLLVGTAPLDFRWEAHAVEWMKLSRGNGRVIVALVPPVTHERAFAAGAHPQLSLCAAAGWGGVPKRLASIAMAEALLEEKPGVFLSYRRDEASGGAEALHDALIHAGYRVFLDRVSGTPGRQFPRELAEAMSSMGLVVLFETASLRSSGWTMWEARFARRFRLGPIAINFAKAPEFVGATTRMPLAVSPLTRLPDADIRRAVNFVDREYLRTAVARQAYFETLIALAARSKGGSAIDRGGLVSVSDGAGAVVGTVLAAAVPGRLRHVARLARSQRIRPHLLAGEHQHLAPCDLDDLRWLAQTSGLRLTGSGSVYGAVRRMM